MITLDDANRIESKGSVRFTNRSLYFRSNDCVSPTLCKRIFFELDPEISHSQFLDEAKAVGYWSIMPATCFNGYILIRPARLEDVQYIPAYDELIQRPTWVSNIKPRR